MDWRQGWCVHVFTVIPWGGSYLFEIQINWINWK
jgi:hypothetical protein